MRNVIISLFKVKSLVTIILTAVFAHLALTDRLTADQVLTIYSMVIAFYFGTQAKKDDKNDKE